ncbi:hypothetical protein [Microbispora sp. NPDC049633]|uniref:hypothetical protein n=1 Tax=Microbispora sp. NPDC049633 TaxID=3154355 RepID=UPI0034388997
MKYETETAIHEVNVQLTDVTEDDVLVSAAGRTYRPQRMTIRWSTGGTFRQHRSWVLHGQLVRKSDGALSSTWMEFVASMFAEGSMDPAVFDQIAREVAARLSPPADEAQTARDRVRAYVAARRASRPGVDYVTYAEDENGGEQVLNLSDLEKLVK